MSENQNEAGRKPDYIAYNVQETRQGKPVFNRVGAAWQHRDGQGYDIQLDSTPVNGRVTLREMRDQQMQNYKNQEQEQEMQQEQDFGPEYDQDQSHEQANNHGRTR